MYKKYCLINSNGKYLASYEESELTAEDLRHTVFAIPPNVKDGFIAVWNNGSWNIKKETVLDGLNNEYYDSLNEIQVSTLISNIQIRNRLIPSRNGNYVSKIDMIKALNSEYDRVKNIFLTKYKKKQTVPDLYKDYAKEIKNWIANIEQINTIFTDFQYTEEDDFFELSEILEHKPDFDIAFASENNT